MKETKIFDPADGFAPFDRMFVFFDGQYRRQEPSAFPFVFTLGCLELDRPR
jgi:hypothetical protein